MSKLSELTGEQLVAAVREAASEQPFKSFQNDSGCSYFSGNGRPRCVVGAGLFKLGIRLRDVADYNDKSVNALVDLCGLSIDGSSNFWLAQVQNHQDLGAAWSEAVARADRAMADEAMA